MDRLTEALAWYASEGQRLMDWEPVVDAARLLANGQRVEWCQTHRVEQKVSYVDGYSGLRECQEAPYFADPCRIVSLLLVNPEEVSS